MQQDELVTERAITEEGDFLKLNGVDYVHFWVGNAKQAMYFW
jgi:hypothetical protein